MPASGEMVRETLSLDQFVLGINQLVFGAAYFFGTLLGLFATVPLISGFLEKGRIDLLLSKPVHRASLYVGHLAGVWLTVLTLTTYLIGAIWIVISVKTGLWIPKFLIAIPVITVMFAVLYSAVVAFGIWTRSPGLALVVAYGLAFFSFFLALKEQILPVLGSASAAVFSTFYHVFPNYIEVVKLMAQLGSGGHVESWYPLYSSVLFGITLYGFGLVLFTKKDF